MTGEITPTGDYILNQSIQARLVVPSDATVIPQTRALYNGNATACDIAVIMCQDSTAVTFKNVAAGEILPISVVKVMNTNTTAAAGVILALY